MDNKFSKHVSVIRCQIDKDLYAFNKIQKYLNIDDKGSIYDIQNNAANIVKDMIADVTCDNLIDTLVTKLSKFCKIANNRGYCIKVTVRKYDNLFRGKLSYEDRIENIIYDENGNYYKYNLKISVCRMSYRKHFIDRIWDKNIYSYKWLETLNAWFVIDENIYDYLVNNNPNIINKNETIIF